MWTEKYRPSEFKDIRGQKDIVKRVKAFVEQKNMPHLLFAGPAGVGKTTLSIVTVKQLYKDSWHENFLELNASDERGIDVIRVKVKEFARTKAIGNVPFKIIYLDECLEYDSKITLRDKSGEYTMKIGEFVEKKDIKNSQVLSVDDNREFSFVNISNAIKIPHDPANGFYELSIHDKTIKLTGNHMLLTPAGWIETRNIRKGELVLCPLSASSVPIVEPAEPIIYQVIGLPQEIKKKERYITHSPEKAIIELLSTHAEGLSRNELTKKSGIATTKLSSLLSKSKNEYYISLLEKELVRQEKGVFKLNAPLHDSLKQLYEIKRTQRSNDEYVITQLSSKNLYPLQHDNAIIAARILGHLFSDGTLSLKAKQLFFSGKDEDLRTIRKDINALGYYSLGNIRYSRWKNGECWSFGAYKIDLLSFFYSLGAPVGKKTAQHYNIPKWILNGTSDIKRAFLSSFFGGEGSCPKFQGRTIKPILFVQHKDIALRNELEIYLSQFKLLLSEFGINSRILISNRLYPRKDGTHALRGELRILNSRDNILRFLENIGYSYCKYKEEASKDTIQYLTWKKSLGKHIYSLRSVPYFAAWKDSLYYSDTSYYYVTGLKKIEDPEWVYCLSTENKKFIANDVIVHNCDALTKEAQQALRRTMENYTQTCRFILSCNYSSKIIEPIQSRCAVFRFKPLAQEDVFDLIDHIAKNEKLSIDEKAKHALVEVSEGDCRKLENILQACAVMGTKITEEVVFEVAGFARPKEINEILELVVKNDFAKAKAKLLDTMLNYGLSGLDLIKQLHKEVWKLKIDDLKKLQMVKECAEIEFRMVEGSDEFLQLESLLANFILINSK